MQHIKSLRLPKRLIFLALCAIVVPGASYAQNLFTHVHMRVADTAEAAAWHHELFGADVIQRGPGPSLQYGNGLIMTMPTEAREASSIISVSP